MTGKHGRDVPKRLSLLHEGAGATVTVVGRNPRSPYKRRIPRKPSPAQIERFEALRARVMGIPESR
ncbi:hypothetical protein AA0313_2592 [Acetobacter indonesiensis NRIC 0313]|uniref:Uncharacterized protein n=1 Tax=Acetobacter indonesiensis TaxID=104101 RepID=A0A6N3T8I1_9PROT|nr:hypothetical protein [Acetobacter indonesiensis]GAN63354.1 hypothetical protein Abin_025_015 [Acetobacter indonesiensis]GBQ61079.1 hypothetical protein AA0313_2592 [Acetobacter indonesiensis NRIC 0313]GEN04875.1 hypothetical protein AIN02nite_29000 [Acetobacter indonesiensis]